MIHFNFDEDCCGCAVCADSCPVQCIKIVENQNDFLIPQIDTHKCINCGKCEVVCPVLNTAYEQYENRKLLCAFNNNEQNRDEGSSGSIFYIVAKYVINCGGVVFGAAFDSKLQLKHQKIDSLDDIAPLMKSKYIQSDTNGVYKQVKDELELQRYVLFVGTPCQTQALYNFLGRRKPNHLILIDFICHGVPSQKLFNKAIFQFECRNYCKVVNFSFRKKRDESLHCYSIEYIKNGSAITSTDIGTSSNFPYYCGYLKYYTFRESCYQCKFTGKERVSDLTLGDFWGLEEIDKNVKDFNKGYSMLIVNSEKGRNILDRLKEEYSSKEYNIQVAVDNNYAYTHPTHKSIVHKILFRYDYHRISYDKLEKRYFSNSKQLSLIRKCIRYTIQKYGI